MRRDKRRQTVKCREMQTYRHTDIPSEQGTTSVHKFAIFFLKLSRKTIICLLHVCWPMPICCKGKRKRGKTKQKNKNQKTKKNKKNRLVKVTKIGFLGVSFFFVFHFCFFSFFGFLVSCFLVRCWFFEGLAKQHKSEGPRPHSLPVLPL